MPWRFEVAGVVVRADARFACVRGAFVRRAGLISSGDA
jgi:hypothetical protein